MSTEPPLWIDKYRPGIDDFTQDQTRDRLKTAIDSKLNLFLYGPSGSGKTAAAHAIANELHSDTDNDVITLNVRDFFDQSKKEIRNDPRFARFLQGQTEFSKQYRNDTGSSNTYKRSWSIAKMFSHVIEQLASIPPAASEYKTIILDNAEDLREDLQESLRRTIERYYDSTQFVFVSRSAGNVIPALRSRCLMVPVPRHQRMELISILEDIATSEGLDPDIKALHTIAGKTGDNLRRSILLLQSVATQEDDVTREAVKDVFTETSYEKTVASIFESAEAGELKDARDSVDTMLDNDGFSGKDILKLFDTVIHKRYSGETLKSVVELLGDTNFRLNDAANPRIHLMWFISEVAATTD